MTAAISRSSSSSTLEPTPDTSTSAQATIETVATDRFSSSDDSQHIPPSLVEKDIAPLELASIANSTSIISDIEYYMRHQTAESFVSQILNAQTSWPGGGQPLGEEVDPVQMRAWADHFLDIGRRGDFRNWWPLFAEDAIYVADAQTVIIGRENIEETIGAQIKLVEKMTYEFPTVAINGNMVAVHSVNKMVTPEGKIITYVNTSHFWFNKSGKVKAAIDIIDKATAAARTTEYLGTDLVEGGDACCGFCSGLVAMVKKILCCGSNPKAAK